MNIPILRIPFSEDDLRFITTGIDGVLRSGMLTNGPHVRQFEADFAAFCGVQYAVATSSGTSALEIILRSINVAGATVVVPSNTYMATAMAVIKAGGRVILADCRQDDLQLDPDDLEPRIRSDTKAVILVHIGGSISPHLERIQDFCASRGLILIEDAAHAHGATFHGRKAGSLGRAGAFSFFPTKILTTAEGGMITTNDEEIFRQALVLREHGKSPADPLVHIEIGDNWRMSELHAVIGEQQLRKAKWLLAERRRVAAHYDRRLSGLPGIRKLIMPPEIKSCYYKYIAFLGDGRDREALKKKLAEKYGVRLTGEVYAQPCHSQPVFDKYPDLLVSQGPQNWPGTDYACQRHICLPCYPGLDAIELDHVVESLVNCLK